MGRRAAITIGFYCAIDLRMEGGRELRCSHATAEGLCKFGNRSIPVRHWALVIEQASMKKEDLLLTGM